MKYMQHVNELIGRATAATDELVLFGQNIAAGSHITGLTKNLKVGRGGLIINTQNSENSLTGIGFGMMQGGVSSIYFMKQLDFLLLGVDQLVNTYNFMRRKKATASFTIVAIIDDLGWDGMQSSFANFGDMCSIARVPGFTITNRRDAEEVLNTHLISPGFRIIGVSQRLSTQELLDIPVEQVNKEKTVFRYGPANTMSAGSSKTGKSGKRATIACFNLSFPQGLELRAKLGENNIDASLYSVNAMTPVDWSEIVEDAQRTGNLVVLDDSGSKNRSCDNLRTAALMAGVEHTILLERDLKKDDWLFPHDDVFIVDHESVLRRLTKRT